MVDLLRHTAGLTYSFQERTPVDAAYRKTKIDDFDADYTMDSFIAGLAKIPLQFDPGALNYSMATDVLGAVIERIEASPLPVCCKNASLALGMVDTGFKVPADKQHRLTDWLRLRPEGQEGLRQRRPQPLGKGPRLSFGRRRTRLDAGRLSPFLV